MKKIYTLASVAILGIVFSGCADAYYNVAPNAYYNDVIPMAPTQVIAPSVTTTISPAQVIAPAARRVVVQDPYRYLRRNAYGYRYYY
jgi:PBP1b-binding outer membrane lipoprotein LpoB